MVPLQFSSICVFAIVIWFSYYSFLKFVLLGLRMVSFQASVIVLIVCFCAHINWDKGFIISDFLSNL